MIFQQASFTLALVIQLLVALAFFNHSNHFADGAGYRSTDWKTSKRMLPTGLFLWTSINETCSDAELKEALRKLSEAVKYSTRDQRLCGRRRTKRNAEVSELRINIDDGQIADAKQACGEQKECTSSRRNCHFK